MMPSSKHWTSRHIASHTETPVYGVTTSKLTIMFVPLPTSLLVADPQADIWNGDGITSINMVHLQEEDQITQVTDPSAGCTP
jgi:hypothetical protein